VFHLLYNSYKESGNCPYFKIKEKIMTTTTKKVNYTPAAIAMLEAGYDGTAPEAERMAAVKRLVAETGKNQPSVIAKLTNLGLYVPKEKTATGRTMPKKSDMVATMERVLSVSTPSAAKMTRLDIGKITAAFLALTETETETETDETDETE
jgi:hypothetical protein